MRNSNLTLKLACYLIVAALLVWLGIYAYQALNDPYRTVPVTSLNIRDSVEVRGIVAREEQVLYSVYSSVRGNLSEGTRVAAGGTVAEAYDSEEAMLRAVRLAELRAEGSSGKASTSRISPRRRPSATPFRPRSSPPSATPPTYSGICGRSATRSPAWNGSGPPAPTTSTLPSPAFTAARWTAGRSWATNS